MENSLKQKIQEVLRKYESDWAVPPYYLKLRDDILAKVDEATRQIQEKAFEVITEREYDEDECGHEYISSIVKRKVIKVDDVLAVLDGEHKP